MEWILKGTVLLDNVLSKNYCKKALFSKHNVKCIWNRVISTIRLKCVEIFTWVYSLDQINKELEQSVDFFLGKRQFSFIISSSSHNPETCRLLESGPSKTLILEILALHLQCWPGGFVREQVLLHCLSRIYLYCVNRL